MKSYGMPVPRDLLSGADVAYGLDDGAPDGFEVFDAFHLGIRAATVPFRAVLVGDAESLHVAVSIGRAVREANPGARIALVLHESNARFAPPDGVFDRVALRPCDLAAVARELIGDKSAGGI